MLYYLEGMSLFFNKNYSSVDVGYAPKDLDLFVCLFVTFKELKNPLFLQIIYWAVLQPELLGAQVDRHGLVVLLFHYLKHYLYETQTSCEKALEPASPRSRYEKVQS